MNQARRNSIELARHLLVSVLTALIALGPAPLAFAGPKGGVVVKGSGKVTGPTPEDPNLWVINAKNGTIIKYTSFDVAGGETVRFETGDGGLVRVLNRIDGKAPTRIDGAITQQLGKTFMIYIVNPAGVFFGADAKINVTGLQAAAGNLSDRDFERGLDHFTNLKGKVENAGKIGLDPSTIPENDPQQIVTNAVSLVGRQVLNSGDIDTNGWIVMAAGRDVFIGRDQNGNGLLLRVEGGADAVFNKSAKGVTNQGNLNVASVQMSPTTANGVTTPHPSAPAGRITLGAGDLYGTAIFNRGAIQAREIALQASNQGDVALAGEVKASTVGITFGGDKAGQLVGATEGGSTLNADTLNLTATGAKGQVVVGDRFELQRATPVVPGEEASTLTSVNVEQKATLRTSNLAKLDIHSKLDPAKTSVDLTSTTGVVIDDRKLVDKTRLTVEAPATAITDARNPLEVDRLDLRSRFVQTEADLTATGKDESRIVQDPNEPNDPNQTIEVFDPVMNFTGNVQVVTKPGGAGNAQGGTVLSALNGTLATVGDIVTTDGGGLRIVAGDVRLGTLNADGTLTGGSIANSGSRAARVTIVADNTGLDPHVLGSVQAKSIVTQAGVTVPGVDQAVGGDVTVVALGKPPGDTSEIPEGTEAKDYGNINLFGDVFTEGGAPLVTGDPLHDGGSVKLVANQTLTVHNIITGGGKNPTGPDENGEILLQGGNIVLAGNLDATGGTIKNTRGERNRSVTVQAPLGAVTLGADTVDIHGGRVAIQGPIVEGMKKDPAHPDDEDAPEIQREVALSIDSNRLEMLGGADVKSLDILARDAQSTTDPTDTAGVLFSGLVKADDFVHLTFDTANGAVRWGTPTGATATVSAPDIAVTANHPLDSLAAGTARVVLDPGLKFDLSKPSSDPNDPRPRFTLWQSGAIDKATTDNLFANNRFGTGGLDGRTLLLRTNSQLSLDASAFPNVEKTDLNLIANHFGFSGVAPGATPLLKVDSLELTTFGNLDADFDVIASGTRDDQGIGLHAGATGVGNLAVSGNLKGRAILLIAGDGTELTEGGNTEAAITVLENARFANAAGTAAPEVFGIQQDASVATNAGLGPDEDPLLPSNSQFAGGSIKGMEYRLESADGEVSLETGAAAKFAGANLFLNGQTDVKLGTEALTLSGLVAQTRGSMTVSTPVTISGVKDGVIDLSAGEAGNGTLTIDSKLTADIIDLRAAGVGDATGGSASNIDLGDGASFAGATTTSGRPTHFGMVQDATLDQSDLPTLADFAVGGIVPATLDGLDLELRSLGGSLTLTDPTLVARTALALEGRDGVKIQGSLVLRSLDEKGQLTSNGNIHTTAGALSVDTTDANGTERGVLLNAVKSDGSPVAQELVAENGALTIVGKVTKSSAGDVTLESHGADNDLAVGDVVTAHTGGHIDIEADGDVKTGKLDASGTPLPSDPNDPVVRVRGGGAVDVAGIDARGKNGGGAAVNGANGGNVLVSGATLRLGTVDASGGNGGFAGGAVDTLGGDAGRITLEDSDSTDATLFQVSILGDLLAAGGVGVRSVLNNTLPLQRGKSNDVNVRGPLLLLAKAADGRTNAIIGRNVTIAGNVAPGKEQLTEDADPTDIAPSATGLRVVADGTLQITGNAITAGTLDLEQHTGDMNLGTKTIHSDTIRLAATDGTGHVVDGADNAVVGVSQLTFKGANGVRRILSLTLEQDLGFGPGGSAIPDTRKFTGDVSDTDPAVELGLISHDGAIALGTGDFNNVRGTRLTLAANVPSAPGAAPIQISGAGQDLSLAYLQLGSAVGVGGGVGGDAKIVLKNLSVGDAAKASNDAFRAYGDVTVIGDAHVLGTGRFSGEGDQRLDVTGKLEIAGADLSKSTNGLLAIVATDGIDLTGQTAQTIGNEGGRLEIDGALIKGQYGTRDDDGDGNLDPNAPPLRDPNDPNSPLAVGQRGLSLRGISEDPDEAAVKVTGTRVLNEAAPPGQREYAIAIGNGDLSISASQRAPGTSTTTVGKYELGGDVLAFGDVFLGGEGSFTGHKPSYTVEAQRNPFELAGGALSGELTMGGISSADGNLTLIARGDDPSFDIPHPTAIHLRGNFAGLAGNLVVDGSLDLPDDTSISAAGDVRFKDRIQGEKGLSVASKGQVVLDDDVALTGGVLSLAGDSGVRFASTSDTQFIQAGSISLGSGAARTPSGAATIVRDGNLSLAASGGDVAVANGQRMVVNGSLSASAKHSISLTDTAALRIKLVSQDLIVRSGSTVMANSIVSTAAPRVTGGGTATFAVPTRTEVTDNIPSDQVLLRQIHPDGSPLSLAGSFPPDVEFPEVPFPVVSGPAQFDYARTTPEPPLRQPLNRPHVDAKELDASLANRPLWAEELLAYLEERSVETPGVSEAVEHLPPVGARPGDPLASEDRRVRNAAAERAVALYRELFRPDVARNPETGFIDEPARAAAIRAAFQQPIDALRRENGGKPVSGAALRELITSTPGYAPAQGYGAQLGQLVAAGELALTPDQKPRFSQLVLAEVTPYGIAPAEFATAIR